MIYVLSSRVSSDQAPTTKVNSTVISSSPSCSNVTSDDGIDEDYDSEAESAPDPSSKPVKEDKNPTILATIVDGKEILIDLILYEYRYILPENLYFPQNQPCTLHSVSDCCFCNCASGSDSYRSAEGGKDDKNERSCAANGEASNQRSGTARVSASVAENKAADPSYSRRNEKPQSEDEKGDDEEPNKRRKVEVEAPDDCKVTRKVACPFFLRHSERYCNRRSCPGPGWNSVHRLKYVHHDQCLSHLIFY